MAYDGTISAADFNNLKDRIDAECRRRQYTGSVATLPDNPDYKYDSSKSPLKDRKVIQEHFSKIVDQVSYISKMDLTNSLPLLEETKTIDKTTLNYLNDEIDLLEGVALGSNQDFKGNTGCKSSCT